MSAENVPSAPLSEKKSAPFSMHLPGGSVDTETAIDLSTVDENDEDLIVDELQVEESYVAPPDEEEHKQTADDFYSDVIGKKQSAIESTPTVNLFPKKQEEGGGGKSRRRTYGSRNVTIDFPTPTNSEMDRQTAVTADDEEDDDGFDWEEVKEESVEEEEVEQESTIDRNMYYEMHAMFNEQYKKEKLKNNYLQIRLASYYTKRKMLYVLREPVYHVEELQKKYEKELEALEQLIESSEHEKTMSQAEYTHLQHKKDTTDIELTQLFQKLLTQEMEYGKGLTFEKTGRHNMDKIVERFIRRQKIQIGMTMKLRSEYINLRNRMTDKTKALEDLDHLGPGFRIMDYVQLKSDNRDLHDKFEEKESELLQLRQSCQHTMQILAHNREKSAVIDLDKENLKEEVEAITMEYEEARQSLHYLQQDRDNFRSMVKNLKMQYSLFINRKLLRDMEMSVDDLEQLKQQLEDVKSEFLEVQHHVKMVRKNMRYFLYHKNKEKNPIKNVDDDDGC